MPNFRAVAADFTMPYFTMRLAAGIQRSFGQKSFGYSTIRRRLRLSPAIIQKLFGILFYNAESLFYNVKFYIIVNRLRVSICFLMCFWLRRTAYMPLTLYGIGLLTCNLWLIPKLVWRLLD